MMNPDITNEEYQNGQCAGYYDVRYFVFARDNYTCICCGKSAIKDGVILKIHHLGYRTDDRSNRMTNLGTVCSNCHTSKNHQKGGKLYDLKPRLKSFKGATFMTMVRYDMFNKLKEVAPDVNFHMTYGAMTKLKRKDCNIKKSHSNDAYCMGEFHPIHRTDFRCYQKLRRNNRILSKFYDAKYIDLRDFACVYNENAVDLLKYKPNNIINYPIIGVLSDSPGTRYHNLEMFKYILIDYFKEYIDSDTFIFDFDGTLYDSSNDALSILNLILYSKLKSRYILSGNYWLHFDNIVNKYTYSNAIVNWESIFDNLYCSFGAVHCVYKDGIVFNNYTTNEFDITKYFEKFCLELRENINIESNYFVDNRSGVNFAIRPLKNREELLPKIQKFVKDFNDRYNCNLIAEINGKTTIDILHADYNKRSAIDYILPETYSFNNVTYVGDSFKNGNDKCLVGYKHIKCLSVEDIYDTNLLLNTILSNE